jgi:hypothetical protein
MSINVHGRIATVQRGPIHYRFDALEEDFDPREAMDDEETIDQIRRGELEWFLVRCQAIVADVVLASSYLGGNCYRSFSDFMDDCYVEDLIEEARVKAIEKLRDMGEALQELRVEELRAAV